MKWRLITVLVIWVALVILIGWDVVVAIWGSSCSTISCIMGKSWAYQHSTLPLTWGVLTGHLFWIARGKIEWMWCRLAILVVIACASATADFAFDFYDVVPILPVVLGVPLGRLLWPQSWPTGHPLLVWKR